MRVSEIATVNERNNLIIPPGRFYPSILAYITLFYPRYECAFRFALFYGFFSVAGAFGGLIAYGIFQ